MSIIGINPALVNDTCGDLTFANAVKHARGFFTPGAAYSDSNPPPIDANGEPKGDFGILFATVPGDVTNHYEPLVDGRYGIKFTGQATVTNGAVLSYNSATNTTTGYVDLVANTANGLLYLDFDNTRRHPTDTTNTGITDLHIMRPVAQGSTTYHDWDELFSRQFLQAISPFRCLRALDLCGNQTNSATPQNSTTWAARQLPSNPIQTGDIAYEYAVMMANANSGADLWMPLSVYANDDHVTKFFQLCLYGSDGVNPYTSVQQNPVYPPLQGRILFTYGNETWNDQFSCTGYIKNTAAPAYAQAHSGMGFTTTDVNIQAAQYCAVQAVRLRDLAAAVYGEDTFGVKYCPIYEHQQPGEDNPDVSGLKWGLDFANGLDNRPLNKKLWGCGNSFYHTWPPTSWTNSGQSTVDQIFSSVPQVTTFPNVQGQYNLAHSYGLKVVGYEGGEHIENPLNGFSVDHFQNDARFAPYVVNIINLTAQLASVACVYSTSNGPWALYRSTNDLTGPEATKYKATVQALAAAASVTPPSNYPAFTAINQSGWSSTNVQADIVTTGLVTFAQDTLIEASVQGSQPAAGMGVGLYVDGLQVAAKALPIQGQYTLVNGGRVRLRALVPAGDHTVEVRNLQANTSGGSAPATITPLTSNTVETDTLLYSLDLSKCQDGDDLAQHGWSFIGGPRLTYSASQGLFVNGSPGQGSAYSFAGTGLAADYAVEINSPTTFTAGGQYDDSCKVVGRFGTNFQTENSAAFGFNNLGNSASGQTNARYGTIPGPIQLRCVGPVYTGLGEGFEVTQLVGTGQDTGGNVALVVASSQLNEIKVWNIATSVAALEPTTVALSLPASGTVGTPGTATVTLSGGPASVSAITVALSYTNATGPASVTVAAGSLTKTFSVTPTATNYAVTPTVMGLTGSGTAVMGTATSPTVTPGNTGTGLTVSQAAALAQIPTLVTQVTSLTTQVQALASGLQAVQTAVQAIPTATPTIPPAPTVAQIVAGFSAKYGPLGDAVAYLTGTYDTTSSPGFVTIKDRAGVARFKYPVGGRTSVTTLSGGGQ